VLAHAPRADVLMGQPWPFSPYVANGTGWYYFNPNGINETGAWGFVNAGDTTSGGVCDASDINPELRLCFHTQENFLAAGYRCGSQQALNGSMLWQRYVLHRFD
jgi:hypothetical protein